MADYPSTGTCEGGCGFFGRLTVCGKCFVALCAKCIAGHRKKPCPRRAKGSSGRT